MASPGVSSASITIQQRQPLRPFPTARQHLIEARVSVEGRVFRTFIREGATVNELIEKVARENGGSVEKKYYPEFKTYEITRVRIGDILLVKGSKGIHFGLGEFGIPFASAGEQIVFPNADELRVSKETSTIGLWMTADNFNADKTSDFDRKYEGGTRVSGAAREELEKSHGGMRSEKLLLHDNILVIDKETGEISTVSEYAARVEGFASPQFQTPTYTSVGLTLASDRGVLALPMDGSINRVPYLFVKTFDGKITDHISIQFNPLKADACPKPKERIETRSDAATLHFSALSKEASIFGARSVRSPFSSAVLQDATADKPLELSLQPARPFHSMKITPEIISHYWRHPRLLQKEGIMRTPPQSKPCVAPASAPKKLRKEEPQRLAEKSERMQEGKKAKPRPKTEAPRRRKRRPHQPAPSMPLTRKKEAKKPKIAGIARTPLVPNARKKEKRAKRLSSPKAILKDGEAKPRLRARPEALAPAVSKPLPPKAKPRVAVRDAKKKRPKKNLPAYFRMELLGLLHNRKRKRRFSRGRAAARN